MTKKGQIDHIHVFLEKLIKNPGGNRFLESNGLNGHDCDEKCRGWCGVAHEGWQNGAKWPQWHGADKGMNMQRKK